MARLAPFGARCIQHQRQRLETDQIHTQSRDGSTPPPGNWGKAVGGASRALYRWELLPLRLKVLFPFPPGPSESAKIYITPRVYEATKDFGHLTLRHGADFFLPAAVSGLGLASPANDWVTALQILDFEGCHDHLLHGKPSQPTKLENYTGPPRCNRCL